MHSFLAIFCLFVCLSWTEAKEVSQEFHKVQGVNKTYFIYPEKRNANDASILCGNNGLELLTINNDEETEEITLEVVSARNFNETFWTSGYYTLEMNWVWGSTNQPITYTNWGKGQPTDGIPNKDCILFTQEDYEGTWINADCQEEHVPICEQVIY
ncbi:unnamed protein product [Phyllotreta striolata]|uniref:C-type lectin domain-containing protein n=1 Tax=Phyllotreta striolata TaxID=444603 RepID=A0A9N9TK35_PHYSR|nr:unnamed protein product [Phyllotreta striolata]